MSRTDNRRQFPTQQDTEAKQKSVRLDRWLWAARFFKTRSLAKTAIEGGKVHMDGTRVKPAKEVRVGNLLRISKGQFEQTVIVDQLSDQRGPAKVAVNLYTETHESIETRQARVSERRMLNAGLTVPSTRPSKKGRRELRKLKNLGDEGDQEPQTNEKSSG